MVMTHLHCRGRSIFVLGSSLALLVAFTLQDRLIGSSRHQAAASQDDSVSCPTITQADAGSPPATTVEARSLWIGGKKELAALSLENGQPFMHVLAEHLKDIAVDNTRKVVWTGTEKEIIQYDFEGGENFRIPLKPEAQKNIDEVEDGDPCLSDADETRRPDNTACHDGSGSDRHVRISIDPSDGSLWIGSGRELVKLSFDARELLRITGSGHISSVSVDSAEGTCWVGGHRRISKYSADGLPLLSFALEKGNSIRSLAADPASHELWIGTKKGLVKVDAQGQELFRTSSPFDIRDLQVNGTTGSLWLITKKDVWKYSKENQLLMTLPLCMNDGIPGHEGEGEQGEDIAREDDDKENEEAGNAEDQMQGILVALAVDSIDDTCWTASRKTVYKVSNTGDVLFRISGFRQIAALDIGNPDLKVMITEPQAGAILTAASVTVKGTISDPAAAVAVNGRKAAVMGLQFELQNFPLTAGTNTIEAVAANLARQSSTDTVPVIYQPPDNSLAFFVCPEPYWEQQPHPPSSGCVQQVILSYFHWNRGFIFGQVDDATETLVVDGIIMTPGSYIINQGRILSGQWTGSNFWALLYLAGPDGVYPVITTVADGQGNAVSTTSTFVKDTIRPIVTITSPADGTITKDQTLTINGCVDDPTAVVMEGWTETIIPAVSGAFSYEYNTGSTDGPQYIEVRAIDPAMNQGYAMVMVIRDATPPRINITAPLDGMVTNSQAITVSGSVADQNPGSLSISVNNGSQQPLTLSGTSFSETVSLAGGSNTLLITATDQAGNASAVSRNVIVDQEPPTAVITSPSPNSSLTGAVAVSIAASDAVSGIQSVILLLDSKITTTFTQPPYDFPIDTFALSPGAHSITVRATDKAGNPAETSLAVNVQHQFGIQITSPAAGAMISRSFTIVKGTINMPSGREIGVTVNGIPAEQQGAEFAAIIPLQQGQNTIAATAANVYGIQEQASIVTYTGDAQEPLRLAALPASGVTVPRPDGIASFGSAMTIETYLTNTIAAYTWDTNGDGSAEQSGELLTAVTATYQIPGLYFPTVTVTDTMGNTFSETAIVNVLDRTATDALLQAKWTGMKTALVNGDVEGAVGYFHPQSQERYRAIFAALGSRLPAIIQNMQATQLIYAKNGIAKYRIRRSETSGAQMETITYYIYYMIDDKGIWRINKF
jgi:hypothetical protein